MKPRPFVSSKAAVAHGSYTVLPVMNGKLLDSPYHIYRLVNSYQDLCGCDFDDDKFKPNENHKKKSIDISLARMVYDELMSHKLSNTHTGCITCVLSKEKYSSSASQQQQQQQGPTVSSLFTPLDHSPLLPSSSSSKYSLKGESDDTPNIVETFVYQRKKPQSKDIQWIPERVYIENQRKLPSSLEILLLAQDGQSILEGLISNFFAFNSQSNTLYTAPDDDVLPGSMSRLVLAAASKRQNISVIRESPSLGDLGSDSFLDAAFVTSAIKIFSFVDELLLPSQDTISSNSDHLKEKELLTSSSATKIHFNRPAVLEELRLFLLRGLQSQDPLFLAPEIPYPLWWPLATTGTSTSASTSASVSKDDSARHIINDIDRDRDRNREEEFNLMYQYINLI